MHIRIPALFRSRVWWLIVTICALEFLLFDQFGARRHTAVYPRWNDQVQYLGECYTGYEFARARGIIAGLLNALTNIAAQGTLHDFFALLVFHFAGPSRSAALSVNMLALVAWQIALYLAVSRVHHSRPLAIAAAMLPLALTGPWQNIPGGAYDFRLDHLAMCALGITAATGLLVDGFRSRRASVWFGVAVGLTVLTRFLTGTYFVLIFAGLAGWIYAGGERRPRFQNLLRAALTAAMIAGPILWINYEEVREYYWIGHYVGPESAIRNQNMGVVRSVSFVLGHLAQRHLGIFFGAIALVGTVVLAFGRTNRTSSSQGDGWIVAAVFLGSPLLILSLHPQKSEVVVGALAPGVVTLTLAAWATAARRASPVFVSSFAAAVVLVVLAFFARAQGTAAYSPSTLADIRQVNTIADRVFTRVRVAGLREPRVAVDHITDALDGQVLRVIGYERKHGWIPFHMTLPTGIAEPTDAVVMERLRQSDFVFLTEEAPAGPYPFDRKLAAMRPQLRAWCEANLRRADGFTLFGRRMVLYQRREIPFP